MALLSSSLLRTLDFSGFFFLFFFNLFRRSLLIEDVIARVFQMSVKLVNSSFVE